MNTNICEDLTVTVSVYKNDNPEFFKLAVDSVLNQTLKPCQLIITVDGPVTSELEKVIAEYEQLPQSLILRSAQNQGQGLAHAQALSATKTRYLAIMDGDDISEPDRFEKQMAFLKQHPEVHVLGGYIEEFVSGTNEFAGMRIVPLTDRDIKKHMVKRCPFNHMSTIVDICKVLESGNYQDWHYNEDYFLWCRMYLKNAVFANIPETLVKVRVGSDMYKRRGGWKYFVSEAKLQAFMLKNGMLNIFRFCFNVAIRFILQVLMPNSVRGFVFQKFARSKKDA